MTLCLAVLFFVLTPGILLRLPKGGSKMMVAATHAVVFVLVFHLMHKLGWKAYEGFSSTPSTGQAAAALALAAKTQQAASALNTGAGTSGSAPKKLAIKKK